MTFGVTSDGFKPKTAQDIEQEIATYLRGKISKNLTLTEKTGLGNFIKSEVEQLAEAWAALKAAYDSFDPDNADEASFVALCELTGTRRNGATRGVVQTTCNFDAAKSYDPGNLVANVDGEPGNRWVNRDPVRTTTLGNYPVVFVSESPGAAAVAAIGTLNKIAQPIAGWNSVNNPTSAAAPGTDIESLEDLATRREEELVSKGSNTVSAIKGALERLPGVIECVMIVNNTPLSLDPAPNSYRAVIWDGIVPSAADSDIAQTILDKGSIGIKPGGDYTGTAIDAEGKSVSVAFSRAVQRNIWIDVTVLGVVDPADVKFGIYTKLSNARRIGRDVDVSEIVAAAMAVPGVTDVKLSPICLVFIGTTPAPTASVDVPIGYDSIVVFDVSRIAVTVLPPVA